MYQSHDQKPQGHHEMLNAKVLKGSLLTTSGQLGIRLLDFLAVIVTARLLFPEDFGLVALGSTILMVFNSITNFPVLDALVRQKTVDRNDLDTAFTLNAIRGGILALFIMALAQPIANLYADERLVLILVILSSAVIAQGLISPGMAHFLRDLNFKFHIFLEVFSKLASVVLTILLAVWLRSYWAIIIGIVAIPILTAVGSYFYAPYLPRFSLTKWRSLFHFAGWVTVANTMSTANMYGDRFFIGGFLGPISLGYYYQACTISTVLTGNFVSSISHIFYSAFSKVQSDQPRLKTAFLRTQYTVALIMFPLGALLGALSEPIVFLTLGPNWQAAGSLLVWLFPFEAMMALVIPVQAIILSSGNTRYLPIREFLSLFIRLTPILVTAYFMGLYGAVYARVLVGPTIVILNFYLVKRIVGVPMLTQISNLARPAIGTLMIYLSIWTFQANISAPEAWLWLAHYIVAAAIVALAVYCTTVLFLWKSFGDDSDPERKVWVLFSKVGTH